MKEWDGMGLYVSAQSATVTGSVNVSDKSISFGVVQPCLANGNGMCCAKVAMMYF